jgi:LysM repeat protein
MKDQSTPLNSELLSADARGRKHIPVAVFAVILIHIVLFLVLLIAAGCRSSARAKKSIQPAALQVATQQPASAPTEASAVAAYQNIASQAQADIPHQEPSEGNELVVQQTTAQEVPAPEQRRTRRIEPSSSREAKRSPANSAPRFYIVKSGDTLGKIAKDHGVTVQDVRKANKIKNDLIYPGQKLQLAPSTPLQVRSEKQKRTNEA